MPRQARKVSELNIYHVILRGINRQIIFEEDNDYLQFISILKYYKNRCDFKIYAYCLQITLKRNASSATAERLFHF